ncbi:hypothetical protein R1flu_006374 [Riccia fluitans]|uniref:Secreted protein n=1 Tax=Riccia fluitans TaxID=41844 RepID=A0ABD1YVU3_9MARC
MFSALCIIAFAMFDHTNAFRGLSVACGHFATWSAHGFCWFACDRHIGLCTLASLFVCPCRLLFGRRPMPPDPTVYPLLSVLMASWPDHETRLRAFNH